jgi:hypothetical protein
MNNYQTFVKYGTQMVAQSTSMAAVGLEGSGLTNRQVETGVRKILANLNKTEADFESITVWDRMVVVFKHKEAA